MANLTRGLGDQIRDARIAKEMSLRALARKLDVSPSYVSDIENDRRVPAEGVLRALSRELDLPFDDLMAIAGRFGDRADRYLRREPAAGLLFRRISEAELSEEDLKKLLAQAKKLDDRKKK